jgi:hypothetical protein
MIRELYTNWLKTTNDRQKLQGIYLVVIGASVVVAGLFSLVNPGLGQMILKLTYVAGLAWVVNFLTWAIFLAVSQRGLDVTQPSTRPSRKK